MKPHNKIKMSPTRRPDFNYLDFGGVRREKEICCGAISPKRIPPCFHGPLTKEEMREDPGPEKVGLGYRAVSAVGVTEDVLVRFRVGYDILVDCWERRPSIFEICLSRSITICSSNGLL
jgi:hypothetical protein